MKVKKILYTQVQIEGNEIDVIVTAHHATLCKTIEAVATKRCKSDRSVQRYVREKRVTQITKHGIKRTDKIGIDGFSNYHCLFTV